MFVLGRENLGESGTTVGGPRSSTQKNLRNIGESGCGSWMPLLQPTGKYSEIRKKATTYGIPQEN